MATEIGVIMSREIDVLIIGAGPAGLGAAIESAGSGANVLLMDENSSPGGQLFKQIHKFFGSEAHFSGVRGFEIGNFSGLWAWRSVC